MVLAIWLVFRIIVKQPLRLTTEMINSVSCRNHFDSLLYFIQETCFFLIFTGDHSRVTLDTKEGGDYINASAIKVHNSGAHRLRQRQDNFFAFFICNLFLIQ